jgi:hypothetical protein
VVIVSALRSAITRARKGGFKDTLPEGKWWAVKDRIAMMTNCELFME